MSLRLLYSIIILFVFNTASFSQIIETKLQTVIDSIYKSNPTSVGIMVHVESPDKDISFSYAKGYSDKDKMLKLEKDEPALIASNIKTYISASILRLVEMEKLTIDDPIKNLLTKKTKKLFEDGGYNFNAIKIKHLLSHTSGVQNYANIEYINFISKNPKHRWTRDEQLELTINIGTPLSQPEELFNYSDANYLLLTEIIEGIYNKPFYTAMRELLDYESLGLTDTWIPTLEDKPTGTKELVTQYWSSNKWNSKDIDISVDLYGGGGIACTAKDLGVFIQNLFSGKVVKNNLVLKQIFSEIKTTDGKDNNYYLGLSAYEHAGLKAYGHSGFWGTKVIYIPELNSTISVFILERDLKGIREEIINFVSVLLGN